MKMLKSAVIAAAMTALFSATAGAAPVFSDNFDSYPLTLNWAGGGGWTVSNGTVDLIGNPGFFDFLPGNGRYVDLDGSTANPGLFSNTVNLTGGVTYTLSFRLAGSQRGSAETVDVDFGTATATFNRNSADPFTTASVNFTPTTTGSYGFSFENSGGDNVGALLDNVEVSASSVPEPGSYALMLVAIGIMGAMRRGGQAKD